MMTVEEMRKKKREFGYSYQQIADLAGLPVGTVQKVISGITKAPRHETLKALERAFFEKRYDLLREEIEQQVLRDPAVLYNSPLPEKKPGEYTLDDYYRIPDDRRVELIDGVIYDMSAPTALHQIISAELCRTLRNEIAKRKGSCIPLAAPVDVQLDCDDKTMVQPDVLVICDRGKLINRCIYGAPEFLVEILSPSTRRKDMQLKAWKYANAGVKIYWLIDPQARAVLVYDFEHDKMPAVYGFDSRIPIPVLSDDFEIDFAPIYDYIEFVYHVPERPEDIVRSNETETD